MFGKFKRRRSRDTVPRGGIENLAVSEDVTPQEPEEDTVPIQAAEPEAVPMDPVLARECQESRLEAERRMRADDQKRQTVFACACVVAGFCGITGVIFGTAAVCSRLGQPQQAAMAGSPGVVQGYYQQGGQDIWYDAGGRMHVNVHITREPDKEINIYIDQDGNVSTEEPGEPSGLADPVTEPTGSDGEQGGTDAAGDGDNTGEANTGANGEGEGGTKPSDAPDAQVPKTEAELLAEMEARRSNGGSGYSETDVQYVVRRGDTLSAISNDTGFSVDFLAAYNSIADKNLIITGEILRYPSFTPAE